MNTEATVYSSVQLRERDRLLSDKHQQEIAILERKLHKVKSISDETAKQLFDAVNRGRKLARSLGFDDVYDAQFAIDSVDHDISFRECYDRLHRLDNQLSAEKKEVATLETKLHDTEEKVKELQIELEAQTSIRARSVESNLRQRLTYLNEQYDALKDVKERAAEHYKLDYKKWRVFKNWLFAEDTDHHKHRNEPGITREEKKRRDKASIMRKRQKMVEIGPDLARFEGEPEDGDEALTGTRRPPLLGRVEVDSDKENEGTPVPLHKKPRISTTSDSKNLAPSTAKRQNNPPATTTPPVLSHNGLLKSVINTAAPSSSPTVFLNPSPTTNRGQSLATREPLTFQSVPISLRVKGEPSSTPSPVNNNKPNGPRQHSPVLTKRPHMPCSSDTEDDSQAVYIPISGTPGMDGMFKVPAPPQTSNSLKKGPVQQNAECRLSIQPQFTTPSNLGSIQHKPHRGSSPVTGVPFRGVTVYPDLPCPTFASSSTKEDSHGIARLSLAVPMRSREPNREENRPAKIRKINGDEFGRSDKYVPPDKTDSTVDTPSIMDSRRSEVLGSEDVTSAKKDIRKPQEALHELATPATTKTSAQKRIEDYSAFKGRGRYGKGAESNQSEDTTINAQYTIDANQNGGLNYQYDLVVRNKDERRRLDAGDCECCREYYEGIGPLPNRLQPPLWRSPPATPAKPCLRQSHSQSPKAQHPPESRTRNEKRLLADHTPDLYRQSDIESHKKAISRHRHAWARANTPPGYWDIGFPDTQAVGDINEKAKRMHKRKKAEIEKEAGNETGRYRRR